MNRIRPTAPWSLALLMVVTACSSADGETVATTSPSFATIDATTTTVVITTAAPPMTAPATTAPATTAPATSPTATAAAWAPLARGPFEVGVTTVAVADPDDDRPLTVEVWFPLAADTDTTELAPRQYTLLPGAYYESPTAYTASAELLAADSTFPLVVYSHGYGGLRYLHSSHTEVIASHGYVVVAPDHTGNTVIELFTNATAPFEQIAFDRPTDVSRVIDAFTDPSNPDTGAFATAVDAERIAVTGHSFGGYTAIAMATGVSTTVGDVAADARVDAIIGMAPSTGEALLPDDRMAATEVPMMVLVGTGDSITPVDPNVTRLWDLSSNSPAYRVELVAGEHQTFSNFCAWQEFLPQLDAVPDLIVTAVNEYAADACAPSAIDDERAADITNTYVVQFLDQVLRGGPPIDERVIAPPDDVIFVRR